MIVRDPWTTNLYAGGIPTVLGAIGAIPTTVQLADGTTYEIPDGAWGSFRWVRQADLLAVAFRQVQQPNRQAAWQIEASRRNQMWNAIQAGRDTLSILTQFGTDTLAAPLRVAQDIGDLAMPFLKAGPLLLVLGVVAVAIGFRQGTLRVSR